MQPASRRKPVPESEAGGAAPATIFGRRRAALGAAAVVVVAAVLIGWAWRRFGDEVTWRGGNLLEPASIELRGAAPWVRADIKAEALKAASLDRGLPLTDPDLANRIARAFDTHPWVRRVLGVRLLHPPAAVVEIVCREPAAMVAVKGGLLAVDAESVVLPSIDFTSEAAAEYPRLTGVDSSPQGPEGSRWGDPVVEEGARVASVIGPDWKSLGLVECRPERAARGDLDRVGTAFAGQARRVLEADLAALHEAMERVTGDRNVGHGGEPSNLPAARGAIQAPSTRICTVSARAGSTNRRARMRSLPSWPHAAIALRPFVPRRLQNCPFAIARST